MKKSLDNMSQNDYLEKVSKMTKEELSDVLLNEQNHNSAFIEMVKDEYAYRVLNEESNEISRNDVTPHNSQPEIVKDDRNKNEIKSNIPIFLAIVVAYILLSGLNNLRHMNVPYSICKTPPNSSILPKLWPSTLVFTGGEEVFSLVVSVDGIFELDGSSKSRGSSGKKNITTNTTPIRRINAERPAIKQQIFLALPLSPCPSLTASISGCSVPTGVAF